MSIETAGIAHRESYISQKPKKSSELDSLRDEVKGLESCLHKSATHRASRSQQAQDEAHHIISARREFNLRQMQFNDHLASLVKGNNDTTTKSILGSSTRKRSSSTLGEKVPSPDPYSYQMTLSKKQQRQQEILLAQQQQNKTGMFSSATNLNLMIVKGDEDNDPNKEPIFTERNIHRQIPKILNPLPMVADSVFRDGMISVLIAEGWTSDQALASLIATQHIGTLAEAKKWLRTKLKSGKSNNSTQQHSLLQQHQRSIDASSMLSPLTMSLPSTSPRREINNLSQQQEYHNHQEFNSTTTTIEPPVRSGRNFVLYSQGGGKYDPEPIMLGASAESTQQQISSLHASWNQELQQVPSQFQNGMNEKKTTTTMSHSEMRDGVVPMHAFAEPPLLPPRSAKTSTTIVIHENENQVAKQVKSSFLPQIGSTNNKISLQQQQQQQQQNSSPSLIRLRIKRPTDGRVFDIRRKFSSLDLLATVVMAFLSEQGEDATSSSSREESEKAASFARLVSSTASKWAVVSTIPPKKAYDWTAMDRTTLEDAGIGALGGTFDMVQLQHVKSGWKELSQ